MDYWQLQKGAEKQLLGIRPCAQLLAGAGWCQTSFYKISPQSPCILLGLSLLLLMPWMSHSVFLVAPGPKSRCLQEGCCADLVSRLLLRALEVRMVHGAAAGSPPSASRWAKELFKSLLTPVQGEHRGTCMAALLHFGASPRPRVLTQLAVLNYVKLYLNYINYIIPSVSDLSSNNKKEMQQASPCSSVLYPSLPQSGISFSMILDRES